MEPTGHFADWIIDALTIAFDVGQMVAEPSWENGGYLAADVVLGIVPFVPAGVGPVAKGVQAGVKTVKGADKAAEGVKVSKKIGTTVLGKYPDYIELSDKLGANKFSIPNDIWNKMSKSEQWAANQKFLDEAIARGDEIILSNPVKSINEATGTFKKELDYLSSKEYKLNDDGTKMINK